MEGEPAWLQLDSRNAQLLHRGLVQEVDVVASVNERMREAAGVHIREHNRIQD
jgi:hypothetical protein